MANLDIAKKCLETYMLEVRKYSGNVAPVEVCDQFLCRAYYALGQLVSEQSKTLKVEREGNAWVVDIGVHRPSGPCTVRWPMRFPSDHIVVSFMTGPAPDRRHPRVHQARDEGP